MRTGDIIAATATGHARGPRALIRLSGPGLRAALAAACPVHPAWPVDGACVGRGEMHLDTRVLPCLVMLFAGPRSYTGEDAAELLIPGNPHLVERVLQAFAQLPGVRPATPGEFSARAYLHGRLSLAQAEGVAATIAARTDDELAAAERLLTGETGQLFLAWRDELATLLALVEAGIDFTDQEDVVPIAPGVLAGRLREVADAISCHLGSARGDEERQVLPSVALVGAPNAGKSTLFNALLGRRRSVVSPLAGTTRDVLAERLTLEEEGVEVMLLDLAGLDATATGVIERDAQARARAALDAADVLLHCDPRGVFDASVPPGRVRGVIRVRTKADLPAGASPGEAALGVCALDGYNLGTLRRAIADAVAGGEGRASSRVPRHRRALTRTLDGLRAALAHLHPCERERALRSPELTADAMRGALDALAELTGEVTPDDVIGRVFATFCVGK